MTTTAILSIFGRSDQYFYKSSSSSCSSTSCCCYFCPSPTTSTTSSSSLATFSPVCTTSTFSSYPSHPSSSTSSSSSSSWRPTCSSSRALRLRSQLDIDTNNTITTSINSTNEHHTRRTTRSTTTLTTTTNSHPMLWSTPSHHHRRRRNSHRRVTAALPLFVITLLSCILVNPVSSSGVFEFRFDSFDNPLARDQDGNCCDNRSTGSSYHNLRSSNSSVMSISSDAASCSSPCRIFFRVCLKHYQNNIDTDTPCTFGQATTPVLGNNGIQKPGYSVGIHFNFSWPKTCSYIVDVGHESFEGSRTQPGQNRLIYQLKMQTVLNIGNEWTLKSYEVGGRSKARLNFAIRVTCNENYYGEQCSHYCKSRDDNHGHYLCSKTGQVSCLPGWQGSDNYCKTPQCLAGCHKEHGLCDQPGECKCRPGWEGALCDQCIKYPGCLHGTCSKPYECNCKEGWGGILCNQDLNFCTNHRPCKNGGLCSNSGHGSYNCKCPPNFTGKNCEIELNACDQEPCQNGGTCRTDPEKGNYTCDCPLGYTGRNCESLASLCSSNPCVNGGTCIMGPSGPLCICPPGDFDENNNCRKYTGCHQMPCKNDGKCTQTESGYTCSCQSGFSGNNCEINQDDCAGVICQNGGTCIDGKKDFYCRCPPGYSGKLCQNRVDLCRGFPCANGGTCIDSDGIDYTCSCAPGFTGKHCSVNIDECQPNPCLNGAICQDRVNEFVCHCTNGYTGPMCQYPVDRLVPWPPSLSTLSSSSSSSSVSLNDSFATESVTNTGSNGASGTSNGGAIDSSHSTGINQGGLALGTSEFMPDVTGASVMISIIFATTMALLLVILVVWIFLQNQKRRLEKERQKDEELARSHNEANSRSLMNCLDMDDQRPPFKGTLIINSFNEEPASSFRTNYQLNRQKSLTLSKLSNCEYEANLKLAAGSGKHLVSGGGEKTPNLMRTKSSNKLLNTQHHNTTAGTLKTSKSVSKLNCLLDTTEGEKNKGLLPDVTADAQLHHPSGKAHVQVALPPNGSGDDDLKSNCEATSGKSGSSSSPSKPSPPPVASLTLRHNNNHNNQHHHQHQHQQHRHSVMLPPSHQQQQQHSPAPTVWAYQISNPSLYRSDHQIRPPPHSPAHPHHHLPGQQHHHHPHHPHHAHQHSHAHHHHHHHRHSQHVPSPQQHGPHHGHAVRSSSEEHAYAELSINKSAVINC